MSLFCFVYDFQTLLTGAVAIIVAIIALLNPILGTLLGIYTLWVLLPGEAEVEYRKMSGA